MLAGVVGALAMSKRERTRKGAGGDRANLSPMLYDQRRKTTRTEIVPVICASVWGARRPCDEGCSDRNLVAYMNERCLERTFCMRILVGVIEMKRSPKQGRGTLGRASRRNGMRVSWSPKDKKEEESKERKCGGRTCRILLQNIGFWVMRSA